MTSPAPQRPRDDGPATIGLLLHFATLIALTGAVAMAFGGDTALAVALAVAAVPGFVGSLVYFALDSRRAEQPSVS